MGHVALYRQFRPANFDEIVEQKHAVAALRQSIISGQIAHAYLFCGTRGTGKTSIAKIFSRAVNCLSPQNGNPCNSCMICRGILDNTLMDVIEMDAASNNSVDNIRRICDEVMFLPSLAKYKVYIIDEVHMLSGGAFNALLKTLEEPPAHAIFLLATTEPHRIPATIISRCQRYDFRRISVSSIVERLQLIADAQHVSIDNDALVTIANLSDGALRDAISLFDQVSNGISRQITRDDVLLITGVVDDSFLGSMAEALLTNDAGQIIALAEQLVMDGRDMIRFTLDLAHYFRDLMVVRVTQDPRNLVQATSDSMARMQELAGRTTAETLVYAVTKLSGLVSELKWSPDMRTSFEIALLSFGADEPVSGKASVPSGTARPVQQATQPPKPQAVQGAAVSSPVISSVPSSPAKAAPTVPIAPAVPAAPAAPIVPTAPAAAAAEGGRRSYMAPPPIDDSIFCTPADDSFVPPPMEDPVPPPMEDPIPPPMEDPIPSRSDDFFIPLHIADSSLPPPVHAGAPLTTAAAVDSSPETASSRMLPLSELWAALLHKWEDTLFSDYLQLKKASISETDHVLRIVFPDHMKLYADNLTQRPDYKKINKDIMTLMTGIRSVEVLTEAQRDGKESKNRSSESSVSAAPPQPEWVAQMLAFTESAGIPVETIDRL